MQKTDKILLVDDLPANLLTLSRALHDSYRVSISTSGSEALALAEVLMPDLILLDVMMPGIDGLETLQRLRQSTWGGAIPVILVTADESSETHVRGLELGADDFVTKPVVISILKIRIRNLLARQQAERELLRAKERAEAANRAKSAFLANMSHELRTPLNAMLGFAQILAQDGSLSSGQRSGIETIQRSGDYLLTLINDILDLAKVEAGRFELLLESCEPEGLFRATEDLFRMRAQEKGIAFRYLPQGPLPQRLRADTKRLRQILLNLLGNALKFTEQGEVRLEAGYRDGILEFSVVDSGIGIPQERIAGLFQPFQQEGSSDYKRQGTGLGLAISHTLIKLMGGHIVIESVLGKGSCFCVQLPLEMLEAPAQQSHSTMSPERVIGYRRSDAASPHPFMLLVVDDVASNRAVLRGLLEPLGFRILEAESGAQAVTLAAANPPDLVLLDLVMPDLDGLEVTRRLHALPGLAELPVVVCSASAFAEDRANSAAAGCAAHLAKPVQAALLHEILACHLPLHWQLAAPDPATASGDGPDLFPEQREKLLHYLHRGNITAMRQLLSAISPVSGGELGKLQQAAERFDLKTIRQILG